MRRMGKQMWEQNVEEGKRNLVGSVREQGCAVATLGQLSLPKKSVEIFGFPMECPDESGGIVFEVRL